MMKLLFLSLVVLVTCSHQTNSDEEFEDYLDNYQPENEDENENEIELNELTDEIERILDVPRVKRDTLGDCTIRTYPPANCAVSTSHACDVSSLKPSCLTEQTKTDLLLACNKREVCLACGNTNAWTEQQCDDQFWLDSKDLCTCAYSASADSLKACLLDASALRNSRMVFLQPAFSTPSPSFCNNTCTEVYGPAYFIKM